MNQEVPDVQAGFRKGRGTRDKIANIHWVIEKAREFKKNIYFIFINYVKAFDCLNHSRGKFLKMVISDYLTRLLRNLYACQEATVRTRRGTMDWFQIGKGVHQGCIFSSCLKVNAKVTQLCPTLCDPMDHAVHGIHQARILEWVDFAFSRNSSQPRDQT